MVVVILIARVAFNVLLMVLSGALIATYFHGLGDLIERNTKMPRRYAMIISVVGSFLIVAGLFYLMGTTIQHQIALLKDTLPHTVNNFKAKLASNPTGQQILDYFSGDNDPDKVVVTVQHFFSTSFGVLGDIYIILFLSIFLPPIPMFTKTAF
ncbi:AI-2E family transporter [Mucilaginibacter sp. P19]|uniref:AI-2E family transporter n=1 Tax=Mucilaginibacter sp. P19 TaxID=3423947 RepID=UPI003D67BE1B